MKKAHTTQMYSKVIVSLLFLCFSLNGIGQNSTLLRQTLSHSGSSGGIQCDSHSLFIQQSIGQGSVIGTNSGEKLTMRQGFIQSDKLRAKAIHTESTSIIVSVYPNPFTQELNLELDEELEQNINLQIFDLSGRLVFLEQHAPSSLIRIEIPNLSSGSYILYIKSGNKKFTQNLQKL